MGSSKPQYILEGGPVVRREGEEEGYFCAEGLMRGRGVLFGVRGGRLSGMMRGTVGEMRWGGGEGGGTDSSIRSVDRHSRTEGRKQNEAGSWEVAEG